MQFTYYIFNKLNQEAPTRWAWEIWETNNTYTNFDGNPLGKCQFEIWRKK